MPVTRTNGDRLADIKGRISQIRDERAAAKAAVEQARQAFSNANHNGPVTGWPEFRQAQEATARLAQVEDRLTAAHEEEQFILGQMGGNGGGLLLGDSFLRSPEALRELAQMGTSSAPIGRVNLGVGVSREDIVGQLGMYAAAGESTIGFAGRGTTFAGMREGPRRPLRLLDLIPSAPMDGRSIEYSQEVGSSLDTAAETAEGALKPAHTADFEDAEAVAKTVAHHTKTRKQALADQPQMEGVIRNRLAYGVLRRLEGQVLAGDGTGENLRGILNTTGIASVAYDAGEQAADQALEAIVAVLLSDANPNFVALNPRDWADMLKAKATGSGEYFSGGPFVATAEQLWGATAVPATGIPQGTALVGDATIGATIFVREGVTVIASDSDQDDFVRNRVTLLGEGRFALAIWEPQAFAVVDLAA
jgi:hypothetical protein